MQKTKSNKVINELVFQELARRNFWLFCLYYDGEFFNKRLFLKEVAEAFQQVEQGEIMSLSVSMPPRAGKSYITSLFCAWTLLRNPIESVMRNTCTATLYLKFSYDVRAIMKSDKVRELYPEIKLSDDKSNLQGWNTNYSRQVGYFGAGVGGTIIGFGATKLAITDDLYRGVEDAISETQNDRIIQWKEATHDSRLERECAKIDIGTRWSINDVIGQNIEGKRYEKSIIISAIDQYGNSFCDDVMSTEQYNDIKDRINPDIWIAEYQQEPVDMKGRLFSDIKIISQDEFEFIRDEIKTTLAYIDVADQGADYTAMAIAGVVGNKIYIVDYLFSRDNTDITIPLCAEKLDKWNTQYCRVESNSMGAMFSRNLDKMIKGKVLQVNNQQNKMTRIIMQSATISNFFSFVNDDSFQYKQFIENTKGFSKEGKNKHDDAPDCLAGLSMFIKSMLPQLKI
jgi:predicted phage terminase large subunit-like protein